MRLRRRAATAADLRAYAPFLTVRSRYGSLFEQLPEIWCELLRGEALVAAVVEDLEREPGERLLALGVSVFLTEDFFHYARIPPLFWIGPELVRRIGNNDSPILDLAAIRRANSRGGLNSFTWEVDIRPTDEQEFFAVGTEMVHAYLEFHSGFNIKHAIGQQPFGRVFRGLVQGGGWLIQGPGGKYAPVQDPGAVERAGVPFILGLTRELARQCPGSWLSMVFHYVQPALYFTRGEQRLARAAMAGRTDEEVAEALAVSLSAVKKRWQSIYSKAYLRLPSLLKDDSCQLMSCGARGAEKRRRLLSYLRSHPEELRPMLPR